MKKLAEDIAISIKGLEKKYPGIKALKGVNVNFPRGKITGLIGLGIGFIVVWKGNFVGGMVIMLLSRILMKTENNKKDKKKSNIKNSEDM